MNIVIDEPLFFFVFFFIPQSHVENQFHSIGVRSVNSSIPLNVLIVRFTFWYLQLYILPFLLVADWSTVCHMIIEY